jgi:hypothetical protein
MMFTKMLRDDDNTEEGRAGHLERTKQAIKRARTRLMHARVIGCHDPFIWWTGRPVGGIKETQKNDPPLFDPPFILRVVEEGFTDDGRPVTRCIVASGHAEAGLRPPRRTRTAKTAVA